jgi:hypothetical protein
MKPKTLLASLLVTFAVAVVPAVALADDPGSAVKADVAQLTADVKAAHDGLIADLGALTADAQKGDRAAVRLDVDKLRSHRHSLIGPIRSDRKQLRSDLQAARDAKVDPSTLKPVLQAARAQNRTALEEIHQAAGQARDALKALRQSSKP